MILQEDFGQEQCRFLKPKAGNVYAVNADFSIEKKIAGVTISNGMAWSLDYQTLYYIDTPSFEVWAFKFDMLSGDLSDKKIVIKFSLDEGYPDGMTIDNEGMLWVAHWDGWQVTRWNPLTGHKIFTIPFPVAKVTSCTFGGKDFRDLYITSASTGLSKKELQEQPFAGALFIIRNCGFQGLQAFEFAG